MKLAIATCPWVLKRLGRHPDHGVVGEEGDHGIDVAALDGVREAPDEVALTR
jgi:hypothetical protein